MKTVFDVCEVCDREEAEAAVAALPDIVTVWFELAGSGNYVIRMELEENADLAVLVVGLVELWVDSL